MITLADYWMGRDARFPEALTDKIVDNAAFWRAMLMEVSKWGILGVLGWLAFHAWVAFIKGPQ